MEILEEERIRILFEQWQSWVNWQFGPNTEQNTDIISEFWDLCLFCSN